MHSNRMLPYVAAAAVLAAALIALGAPVASLLPLAALLVCPLMMVFMMRGMSRSHGDAERGSDPVSGQMP